MKGQDGIGRVGQVSIGRQHSPIYVARSRSIPGILLKCDKCLPKDIGRVLLKDRLRRG